MTIRAMFLLIGTALIALLIGIFTVMMLEVQNQRAGGQRTAALRVLQAGRPAAAELG